LYDMLPSGFILRRAAAKGVDERVGVINNHEVAWDGQMGAGIKQSEHHPGDGGKGEGGGTK